MRTILAAGVVSTVVSVGAAAKPMFYDSSLDVLFFAQITEVTQYDGSPCTPTTCAYQAGPNFGISPTLRVMLGRAPQDTNPAGNVGEYDSQQLIPPRDGPSFVAGFRPRAISRDRVLIRDGTTDVFEVTDYEEGLAAESKRPLYLIDSLSISLSSDAVDFIHGDGLVQSFDLGDYRADANRYIGTGEIVVGRRWLDEPHSSFFGSLVKFAITYIRVRPGRCSQPSAASP